MTERFTFISAKSAPVSEEQVVEDLKKVSSELSTNKITQKLYGEHGAYDVSTAIRKFGTWNKALEMAGLKASHVLNVSDEELYSNILTLWEHLGRQPRRAELTNQLSRYSQNPYYRRFSTWTNALQSFVTWANNEELRVPGENNEAPQEHKTGRDPSLRLRFRVMQRDTFTCRQCGASPAKDPNIELHIDHIFDWSKGGDTTFENLQTLWSKCNLGKSNL